MNKSIIKPVFLVLITFVSFSFVWQKSSIDDNKFINEQKYTTTNCACPPKSFYIQTTYDKNTGNKVLNKCIKSEKPKDLKLIAGEKMRNDDCIVKNEVNTINKNGGIKINYSLYKSNIVNYEKQNPNCKVIKVEILLHESKNSDSLNFTLPTNYSKLYDKAKGTPIDSSKGYTLNKVYKVVYTIRNSLTNEIKYCCEDASIRINIDEVEIKYYEEWRPIYSIDKNYAIRYTMLEAQLNYLKLNKELIGIAEIEEFLGVLTTKGAAQLAINITEYVANKFKDKIYDIDPKDLIKAYYDKMIEEVTNEMEALKSKMKYFTGVTKDLQCYQLFRISVKEIKVVIWDYDSKGMVGTLNECDINGNKRSFGNYKLIDVDFKSNNESIQINMYPNPANNEITVEYSKEFKSIDVYDIKGQKMYDFKFQFVESNKAKVETINLKDGIYFFILKLSDGSIVNKKVTIIH